MIYIAHDIFQVRRIVDRIVILENGEKILDAAKEAMSTDDLEGIIRDGGRQVNGGEHREGDSK